MEGMMTFTAIIMIVFGILQIVLFFKIWLMTNDVSSIKKGLRKDDSLIIEAQVKALDGFSDDAFELYKKSFYISVIELYGKFTGDSYGNEDNIANEFKNNDWSEEYQKIVAYYEKRIKKLGEYDLQVDRFDTYEKIHSYICKL